MFVKNGAFEVYIYSSMIGLGTIGRVEDADVGSMLLDEGVSKNKVQTITFLVSVCGIGMSMGEDAAELRCL